MEGANVFFDDASRRYIAAHTPILQIKDSTANKGGVFSSSVAEVLTAFLLGDGYEDGLLNDTATRWALIRDIMLLVERYTSMETDMLLDLHDKDPEVPLFVLSEETSERIFAFQARLQERIGEITGDEGLVRRVLGHVVPGVLVEKIGMEAIVEVLNSDELRAYRDAILTKKLASLACYRFCTRWEEFLDEAETGFLEALGRAVE